LFEDNGNLIIPAINSCYAFDMNTGDVKGKVPWKAFWGDNSMNVLFKVENNCLYIEDLTNGLQIIKCIDLAFNKIIWELKDSYFLGIYKNYVIANNADAKFYLIIDKKNGSVIDKFSAPISNYNDFDFIGDYILINRIAIYK
jgi:outer membrane protein assembly factor BamB